MKEGLIAGYYVFKWLLAVLFILYGVASILAVLLSVPFNVLAMFMKWEWWVPVCGWDVFGSLALGILLIESYFPSPPEKEESDDV